VALIPLDLISLQSARKIRTNERGLGTRYHASRSRHLILVAMSLIQQPRCGSDHIFPQQRRFWPSRHLLFEIPSRAPSCCTAISPFQHRRGQALTTSEPPQKSHSPVPVADPFPCWNPAMRHANASQWESHPSNFHRAAKTDGTLRNTSRVLRKG
jgi:hypothetical protein